MKSRSFGVARRAALVFVPLLAGLALASSIQPKPKLYINGSVASTDVLVRNGVTYAPIKDVAKAFGLTAVKRADGWELRKAGGANSIVGIQGKVGDTLFDGNFQFKVLEVVRGPVWKKRFDPSGGEVTPLGEQDEVLAIVCRLKNGMKKTVTMLLPGGMNTNVTDMEEHSWQPFTGLAVDLRSRGENLVPGSAVDFALTFSIPKTAVLKDLIYQIQVPENVKQTDFRVSLKSDGS